MVRKDGRVEFVSESKRYLNLEDADETVFFTMYFSPVENPLAVELIPRKL